MAIRRWTRRRPRGDPRAKPPVHRRRCRSRLERRSPRSRPRLIGRAGMTRPVSGLRRFPRVRGAGGSARGWDYQDNRSSVGPEPAHGGDPPSSGHGGAQRPNHARGRSTRQKIRIDDHRRSFFSVNLIIMEKIFINPKYLAGNYVLIMSVYLRICLKIF